MARSYTPDSDSPLDETIRDWSADGAVALGQYSDRWLDEMAQCARSILSAPRWTNDPVLMPFVVAVDAELRKRWAADADDTWRF
jgi:hypothetical protein